MNVEGKEKQSEQQQHKQQAVVDLKIDEEMSNQPSIMKSADHREEDAQIEEGLQQLTLVLKSPDTPERQIQIFNIFVNHKPLIGAFCDQEQALCKKLPVNPNASKHEIQIFEIFKSNPSLFTIWSMQRRNFNLCSTCYEQVGHPHEMEKLLDKPPQEANKSSIQHESEKISRVIQDAMLKSELDRFEYNCNKCMSRIETSYHCTICNDFTLCLSCKGKDTHPHEMEKISLDLDDESSPTDTKPGRSQEARKLLIQRCIMSLVHACECKDINCQLASCQRMTKSIQHSKTCKKRTSGGCPICKHFVALCSHHARHCKEAKCPVPFCFIIGQKLRQQQQRLEQALLLWQRMPKMNTRPTESTSVISLNERLHQCQNQQLLLKVQLLKQKMVEMNLVSSESNSTSGLKASPHRNLPSMSTTRADTNEVVTSQQGHNSKMKLSLQKCVSFKKRGLLVRPQKRKFTALVKQSIADSLHSSVANSDVSATMQDSTAENTHFKITISQENSQLIEVKHLLETWNDKVVQLTDTHQLQFNELKSMIQIVNEKIDDLLQ